MLLEKKIDKEKRWFKFLLPAKEASIKISHIIPSLSPYINKKKIENFCKLFNDGSRDYKKGVLLSLILSLKESGEMAVSIKTCSVNYLLKIITLNKCLSTNGYITYKDIYQIVWYKVRELEKSQKLKKFDLEILEKKMYKNLFFSMKSSGIIIKNEN